MMHAFPCTWFYALDNALYNINSLLWCTGMATVMRGAVSIRPDTDIWPYYCVRKRLAQMANYCGFPVVLSLSRCALGDPGCAVSFTRHLGSRDARIGVVPLYAVKWCLILPMEQWSHAILVLYMYLNSYIFLWSQLIWDLGNLALSSKYHWPWRNCLQTPHINLASWTARRLSLLTLFSDLSQRECNR